MSRAVFCRALAALCLCLLLISATIKPVFSRYVLQSDGVLLSSSVSGNVYTVTYMNGNEIYAVEYVWDNTVAHAVQSAPSNKPADSDEFGGWTVAGGSESITDIPVGNTASYVLYANWIYTNKYVVRFVDADATLIYEETFKKGASTLSSAGQSAVNDALIELTANANDDELAASGYTIEVSWSIQEGEETVEWTPSMLSSAKGDVTVRALYTLNKTGSNQTVTLTPQYDPTTGAVTHYQVDGTQGLSGEVTIPGTIGPIPVTRVEDVCSDGLNFGLKKVIFGEGVKEIGANALAMTWDLEVVELPNSLESIGANAFSSAAGSTARKAIKIYFNGTAEEWEKVIKDPNWDQGLYTGSEIICNGEIVWKATGTTGGGFLGSGAKPVWTKQ
jgi:hypothetical protein